MDFTKAQILAARATLFVGPVVRTVINISRSKQWRQKTEKVEARHHLQPLNPEDLRGSYLGQTVVDLMQAQCVDAGLPPVQDDAVLARLLIAKEVHERKLAEIARERKAMREAEKAVA